jgi:hypothetical protein
MGRDTKKKSIACSGTWVPVPLDFLRSKACAELSPMGAKLLLDVLALLGPNATRNGDICLTPKLMTVRGWSGRASLAATVKELLKHGLLVKTRQGHSLDCCLFALTLFPLDCDISKLDVRPGCYRMSDYMGPDAEAAKPPTEIAPARWRHPRKTQTVAPPRNATPEKRTATVRKADAEPSK